jgi:hypothetical protein
VEVCAWIDATGEQPATPGSPMPAALRIGAEGLTLATSTRTWYVAYRDLAAHEADPTGVTLWLANQRRLELRTPAPHVLQRHLESRLTSYARHLILAQRLPAEASPTAPTNQLLSAFENPATPPDERLAIATWLGTRPLERGDALYLQRIVRDIADGDLAHAICAALDIADA